ncbi:HET-domain-containing protein, partial [Lophiostoma macrostomum CBS 122681]
SLNTWSPDSIQAAKAWILNCDTKHPECKQNGNFRPTRLLEITSDTRSAKVIDLGKSHHLSPEGYTVLSHCWGPRGIEQRLTTTNQNEYYRHIACIDLPRNFQDAITVTIDLGFRYIWIDSLCILQDSVDDWRAESVTMGDVFRHAAVTISATASSDSKGGCFRERDSFLHTNCTLMASTTSNLFLDVSPRVRGQCSSLEDLFVEKVDCAPLSLRSWTYQERVLSRRIIHFCDGIILFECNTVRGSEFHDPAGEVYDGKEYIRKDGKLYTGEELETLKMNNPEFIYRWYDLVSAYSGRSITYRSDKLVALSGLVDLIQANTNLEYVAGLWKTTLALDLLWISCQPVQQRSKERIAPSWSWASAEGRIKSILATRPSRRVAQVCIELLQVTDSEALPSTGGASITLNGPVRCVNLSDIPHTLDYVLHEDSESYVHLAVYWESCSDRLVLDMVWGLLLRRADDAPDGVYERCGLATICPLDRQSEWETRQLTLI